MKVKELKNQTNTPEPRSLLYCSVCGSDFSANLGDYFWAEPDTELTCCDKPLMVAVKTTVYQEL